MAAKRKDIALAHAIAMLGGSSALAKHLKVSKQAVDQWKRCPVRRVLQVEQATGGVVSRHRLRPDIYPLGT